MADVILARETIIHDVNKDIAVPAFLAAMPMPQIKDPEWVDPADGSEHPLIDEYPTAKEWVIACLDTVDNKYILRTINKGIDILNQESTQTHLTEL